MNNDLDIKISEFCTTMWRTSGARFNAQRRMKCRNVMSVFTISILSIYLISIAVSQKIYDLNPMLDKHLTFISIVGAVFIIVISLIEWASDFSLKAEKLFENANEIKDSRIALEHSLIMNLSENELVKKLEEVRSNYLELTNGRNPNHEPIDDLFFRVQQKAESSQAFQFTNCERKWVSFCWYFACYGLYAFALVIPIICFIFFFINNQ